MVLFLKKSIFDPDNATFRAKISLIFVSEVLFAVFVLKVDLKFRQTSVYLVFSWLLGGRINHLFLWIEPE